MLRNRPVAVMVIALVALVALVALAELSGRPGQPTPTTGTATPVASDDAALLGAPTEVSGLPVRTVVEALALRDAGSTDRIAVLGWAVRFFVPCPQLPNAYQPLESCVYAFSWLMAGPEQLSVTNPDGSGSIHAPLGPAFNTTYDPLDAGIIQAVVLSGRFHDPRSALCPSGSRRDACERLFVADGAAWLGPTSSGAPGATPGGSVAPGVSVAPGSPLAPSP